AEATPEGWRLSPRAIEISSETTRRVRAHVRGLAFPAEPTKRAGAALWRIAERVPANAVRAGQAKRLAPEPGEPASDAITLTRADGALRITPQGQRTRDAIEEETDRRYFAPWDLDDAGVARVGDDLRTVIDALPKAAA